jgi:hypothetical protein
MARKNAPPMGLDTVIADVIDPNSIDLSTIPEDDPAPGPVSTIVDTDHDALESGPVEVKGRDAAACALACDIERRIRCWDAGKQPAMPDEIADSLGLLLIVLADRFADWSLPRWGLLDAANAVAKVVINRLELAPYWPDSLGLVGMESKLPTLLDKVVGLTHPAPADAGPRRIRLETLAELAEQKLNDRQVCKIFGWGETRSNGMFEPDLDKLKAARAGQLAVPEYREQAPTTPTSRRPHPAELEMAAHRLANAMGLDDDSINDEITRWSRVWSSR